MELNKNNLIFLSIFGIIVLIFSFVVFGITGIRISIGIFLISLPFYLILNNFKIENDEKIVFSLLLGLTLFSSLVYLLGLLISFRLSIAIVFILLIVIAFILKKYKK